MFYAAVKIELGSDGLEAFTRTTTSEIVGHLAERRPFQSVWIDGKVEVTAAEILKEKLHTPLTAVKILHGHGPDFDTWIITRIS